MKKKLHSNEKDPKTRGNCRLLRIILLASIMIGSFPMLLHAKALPPITLDLKQVTIQQVITQIESTTDYSFAYRPEDLPAQPKRDYIFKGVSISQVMDQLVEGTNLEWSNSGEIVTISIKKQGSTTAPNNAGANAQGPNKSKTLYSFNISVVEADTKLPLPGAGVFIKAYDIFKATDMNGFVTIRDVPSGDITIEIRMMGFVTYERTFPNGIGKDLVIELHESSLSIAEVTVSAKRSQAGASTSTLIDREAIDHLQATSLFDLMQLVPGQDMFKLQDMTSQQKITLRGIGANDNQTLGVAVIVDGIPMTTNATMSSSTGINVANSAGVDVRGVAADNIESAEVVTGIASARYGDMTSGMVLVNSVTGKTPYSVKMKIDPTVLNASISKGWAIKKGGSINTNFDYAQAWGDPRKKATSFDRVSAGIAFSKPISKDWSTSTKLSYSGLLDFQGVDPDLIAEGTSNKQYNNTLSLSHRGNISFNKLLSNAFSYSVSYSYSQQDSQADKIVKAGDGIVNVTSLNEGYYEVQYLTESYKASAKTESRPVSFYANVNNSFSLVQGKAVHSIKMGADYRYSKNNGIGYYDEDPSKPYKPQVNTRTRPFYLTPASTTLAGYLEDNFAWDFSSNYKLKIDLGARLTLTQVGEPEQTASVDPRFNASLKVHKFVTIRGGFGISSKVPTLIQLYPEPKYTDREAARYIPVDPNERFVLYHTFVNTPERNNELRNMQEQKVELGIDVHIPKTKINLSLTLFNQEIQNGFSNATANYGTYLSNYYSSTQGLIPQPGQQPIVDWDNPARVDTVFYTKPALANNAASRSRGIEFTINTGKIRGINTTFGITVSYYEYKAWSNGESTQSPSGIPSNSSWGQGGTGTPPFKLVYPASLDYTLSQQLAASLVANVYIPKMKMIASLSGQILLLNKSMNTRNGAKPTYWIDNDQNLTWHPITQAMFDNPDYTIKGILLADQVIKDRGDVNSSSKPLWILHARLSKEISRTMGFSFYVRNMLYYTPFQSSSSSSTPSEKNSDTFRFGMELSFKF